MLGEGSRTCARCAHCGSDPADFLARRTLSFVPDNGVLRMAEEIYEGQCVERAVSARPKMNCVIQSAPWFDRIRAPNRVTRSPLPILAPTPMDNCSSLRLLAL